jgi:hypothetical protein
MISVDALHLCPRCASGVATLDCSRVASCYPTTSLSTPAFHAVVMRPSICWLSGVLGLLNCWK